MRLGLIVGALAAAACSTGPVAPAIASIDPTMGRSSSATPVTISGQGFAPRFDARFDASGTELDTSFSAYLGDTESIDVVWVDAGTLTADVPPGLARGTYELTVTLPNGADIALADAFTIVHSDDDDGEIDD